MPPSSEKDAELDLDYRSPSWSAAKATAKEMWNAQDYVPAKQKLLKKLRDAGLPDVASNFLDAATPDNPTQALTDLAGIGLVGKAGKALKAIRTANRASEMQDQAMQRELDKNRQLSKEEAWEGIEELSTEPTKSTKEMEQEFLEKLEESEKHWDRALQAKPRK